MSQNILWADWPAPAQVIAGTALRSASEADLPAAPQWIKQVHGARAVKLGSDDFAGGMPEADAVYGDRPGDLCVVRTADCLPVLLCSDDGQEIAAVHAGWRGLAAGVIEAAVARMASPANRLYAWMGPAISQPAFEVGDEVRQQFSRWTGQDAGLFRQNPRGRWQADLYGLARAIMADLGIAAVFGGGLCTSADPARFYSYRRDGETGRLLSFIHRRK